MKSLPAYRHRRPMASSGHRLELLTPGASGRGAVEDFIHRVYARAYGADLRHFMPRLFALRNDQGRLLAALGLRDAGHESLYLEHYLAQPVEHLLGEVAGESVSRQDIVELGNLASVHRGGLRNLILALTAYLAGSGTQWVVFTAVPAVRAAFGALGLPLRQIGIADAQRLPDGAGHWGSYYESQPVVLAGRVADGYQRLNQALLRDAALGTSLLLWQCAQRHGRLESAQRASRRLEQHGDAA